MNEQYTNQSKNVIRQAELTALKWGNSYIGTEHLLAGLFAVSDGTASLLLKNAGVSKEDLYDLIDKLISERAENKNIKKGDITWTPKAKKVLRDAVEEARKYMEPLCGTEHILMAILQEPECAATRLLYTMGVELQKLYADLFEAIGLDPSSAAESLNAKQSGNINGSITPALDQYGRDLTQMAAMGKLDPVIGREKEILRLRSLGMSQKAIMSVVHCASRKIKSTYEKADELSITYELIKDKTDDEIEEIFGNKKEVIYYHERPDYD